MFPDLFTSTKYIAPALFSYTSEYTDVFPINTSSDRKTDIYNLFVCLFVCLCISVCMWVSACVHEGVRQRKNDKNKLRKRGREGGLNIVISRIPVCTCEWSQFPQSATILAQSPCCPAFLPKPCSVDIVTYTKLKYRESVANFSSYKQINCWRFQNRDKTI